MIIISSIAWIFGLIITLVVIIAQSFYTIPRQQAWHGAKEAKYISAQNDIYGKYKYLIPRGKMSFNDFCYPTKYSVQPQQKFAGDYMRPHGDVVKEILIYHKIGAGKTCLSIQIAQQWLSRGRPLIVMPASLIPGFRNELRSECAGNDYISPTLRSELQLASPTSARYREIIAKSDELIDSKYTIMSYNKFITDGAETAAPIIIIDEVQNISNTESKCFGAAVSWIEGNPRSSVVIMSGTPLFDNPGELFSLAKLLRIDLPNGSGGAYEFKPKDVPHLFAGKISYFAGAPQFTFPRTNIAIKQCLMGDFQTKWYKSEVEAEVKKHTTDVKLVKISNDFYIKSRQRSNVVYPEGLTGTNGINKMSSSNLTTYLSRYSAKCAYLMKKLRKGKLSFVYSGFTGYGGIRFIMHVLSAHGYLDYFKHGPGPRRYAVWSGDQSARTKDILRDVFNNQSNDDASKLQIIIGSPSIKEGVTLLRVRQVHVMEAYWNHSRLEQIFGRAVRYCSHKRLPSAERTVDIFIYAAVTKKITAHQMRGEVDPNISIDLYMLSMADKKRAECEKYTHEMRACAVDKYLWQ